ncbi:MAG: prolipoprotein diacylglyceryl transferase [Patescibacteria group bacterium]
MIPYFELTQFHLGWFSIQVWGLLVATSFAVSFFIAWSRVKKEKLSADVLNDLFCWLILSVLIFSRIFYVLFGGEFGTFLAKPWQVLAIWQGGMMSTGGFFGAALVLVWFFKRRRINPWPYLDILAYSFPFGWIFGRLACFLMHEHIGRLTNSVFAVNFPGGGRWDLGLLELVTTLVLAIIFLALSRKKQSLGFYSVFLLFWYGLTRFFLDFLRATDLIGSDPRFIGLTLAQWGSLILIILGFFIWKKFKVKN